MPKEISFSDRFLVPALLILLPVAVFLHGMLAAAGFGLLVVAFFASAGWGRGTWPEARASLLLAVLVFAWPLITALWSLTPEVTLKTSLRTALMFAAALYMFALMQRRAVPVLWGKSYALGVCIALAMLLTQWFPWGGWLDVLVRWTGTDHDLFFNQAINRGLCALPLMVWPAMLAMDAHGRRRWALWMPLAVLAGVVHMHSLSAKTGILVSMAMFYLCYYAPPRLARVFMVAVVLFLFSWPLLFHFGEGWLDQYLYSYLPASSQQRVSIWHFALVKWQEKPFFGWGVDTSRVMPGGDAEIAPGVVLMPMHPHNGMLQLLLEQGVVGYLLAAAALAWMLRRLSAMPLTRFARASLLALLAAYLTIGFSAFNVWQAWWVCAALTAWVLSAAFLLPPGVEKNIKND